jgi:hypothetical protein
VDVLHGVRLAAGLEHLRVPALEGIQVEGALGPGGAAREAAAVRGVIVRRLHGASVTTERAERPGA